jgi:hypothetical protein
MPETFASFVSLQYNLKFTPSDISEPEQLYQRALMTLDHVKALGRVVSCLSPSKLCQNLNEPIASVQDEAVKLDAGLFVLGQLIAAIADEGYDAVVNLNDIYTDPERQAEKA